MLDKTKERVCVTDAKCAIRWFKQHAGKLGIDPQESFAEGVKHQITVIKKDRDLFLRVVENPDRGGHVFGGADSGKGEEAIDGAVAGLQDERFFEAGDEGTSRGPLGGEIGIGSGLGFLTVGEGHAGEQRFARHETMAAAADPFGADAMGVPQEFLTRLGDFLGGDRDLDLDGLLGSVADFPSL